MRFPFILRRTHERIVAQEVEIRRLDARFYQQTIRDLQALQGRPQRPGVVIDPARAFEPAAPGLEVAPW